MRKEKWQERNFQKQFNYNGRFFEIRMPRNFFAICRLDTVNTKWV